MKTPRRNPAVALLAVAALACGCAVPVVAGVEEGDANRIVVALDRASVDATKEVDPSAEGRFRVLVPRDDVPRALATMNAEGLPRPNPAGVLSSVDKGALVPSRAAEQAMVVAGLAGDLERTLESVDGVLAARVHLSLPEVDPLSPLRDAAKMKGTASVLLEHRGPTPPIAVAEIERLVAGGIAGLAPENVTVVTIARTEPASAGDSRALAHVGPIAVARTSARVLQVALGALLAVIALLAVVTLSLYSRLARARTVAGGEGGSAT
jgi:type III secretion protein J